MNPRLMHTEPTLLRGFVFQTDAVIVQGDTRQEIVFFRNIPIDVGFCSILNIRCIWDFAVSQF